MAFRSRWWPPSWWRREPCFSSDPAISGPRRCQWSREPISARPSLKRPRTSAAASWWLFGARLLIELGVLVVVVRKAPPRLREIGARRPVLAGAATAAAISVALGLATLPVSAIARERAKDVGLVTQDWVGWLGDVAKSQAIGAVLWGAGGALLIVGMRRLGRRWWIAGAAVVVAFGVAITYASPVVLDPLFNKFTPLEEGRTRSEVLELARRAGVDVGQVYEIDASRRTTAANAYVTGIGHTKRVVLYDNLLKDFTPARDAAGRRPRARPRRATTTCRAGCSTWPSSPRSGCSRSPAWASGSPAARRIGTRGRAARRAAGGGDRGPGASPWSPTSSHARSSAAPTRSRSSSTREPKTQIAFQRRIAVKNVSDPDPPGWVTFLLGTHPPTIERIGQAEAAARASSRDGIDAEAPGQVRDLEQAADRAVERHHQHPLAGRLGLGGGVHDRPERRRVDEVDVGEVEHDGRLGARGRHREHGREPRRGGEVELARCA